MESSNTNTTDPTEPQHGMTDRKAVVCRGCFNLDYNRYWPSTGHKYPEGGDIDTRYRISSFERISGAARRGCRWCCIIYEGVEGFQNVFLDDSHGKLTGFEDEEDGRQTNILSYDEDEEDDDSEARLDRGPGKNSVIRKRLERSFQHGERRLFHVFLMLGRDRPFMLLASYASKPIIWPIWPFNSSLPRLEFYTELAYTPIHQAFGHASTVPCQLTMRHCIATIKSWLQSCDVQHERCPPPKPKLPKRLLHITKEVVQLVETESLPYSPYLTLSHCWGSDPAHMLRTTTKTLEQHKRGIEWKRLPAVFQDALTITKAIRSQWIWIDSLCIVQDDEDDWRHESVKMADVYSNSLLNIAATFSSNSTNTFFRTRSHYGIDSDGSRWEASPESLQINVPDWPSTSDGPQLFTRLTHWPTHTMIKGRAMSPKWIEPDRIAPLLQRAWVFQERLLAPRTVHIGSSELIWECNSLLACECGGISSFHSDATARGLKPRFADACQGRSSREDVLKLWYRMIEIYSGLKLTIPSDRSKALTGISSQLSGVLGNIYMDGIWGNDAAGGLLCSSNTSRAVRDSLGPSWSWMWRYELESATSQVLFRYTHLDSRLRVRLLPPRLEDCAPIHSPVISCPLDIKGFMFCANPINVNQSTDSFDTDLLWLEVVSFRFTWIPDCGASDHLNGLGNVMCVLIGTTEYGSLFGLVLAQSRGVYRPYQRLGYVCWDPQKARDKGLFDHGKVENVLVD